MLAAPDADAAEAVTTGKEPNLLYDEETEPVDYTLLWVLIACAAAVAVAAVVAAVLIAKKKKR